jgi:Ankyrin repeats (3 copies)
LGYAIWLGLTKVVELLFDNSLTGTGHGMENTNVFPWVYLTRAAARGWTPLVQFLLFHGAKVNAIGPEVRSFGYRNVIFATALEAATKFGHLKIAKMLLDAGADVDKQGTQFRGTKTCAFDEALHIRDLVLRKEMVNCLIDAGVDVNYELHTNGFLGNGNALAVLNNSDELFDTVLAAGANDKSMSLAISALECVIGEGYRHGDGVDAEEVELEALHRKLKEFRLRDSKKGKSE